MYAEERRLQILDILRQNGRVDVSDLAARMDTSPETIRRDLREMEVEGYLKRTHGGAIFNGENSSRVEIPAYRRQGINSDLKHRVAKRAAQLVDNGDVIALDNSTTVLSMLESISRSLSLTVITNAFPVAVKIAASDNQWDCIFLGGSVSKTSFSTYGSLAGQTLENFRPAKLFMSCAGIDREGRITEGNLHDIEIKRALMACSQQKYLLVDETKWWRVRPVTGGSAADFTSIITNATVDRSKLCLLQDAGVEIVFE